MREVMTPRTEVDWIDVDATPRKCAQALVETAHSRIPVAEGSVENIVGVIQTRDISPRCSRASRSTSAICAARLR